MNFNQLILTKANGKPEAFSEEKFRHSLARSGAGHAEIDSVIYKIREKIHPGMTTRELYRMATSLLKKSSPSHASRFGLKKAIMELGPSGYPFERFVAALFAHQGFNVEVGQILQGKCVTHEVDVLGRKGKEIMLVECKYHNRAGFTVDVKIPLYIHSRFQDLLENKLLPDTSFHFNGWIATNARFSDDAISYALCRGMKLLGWDFPKNAGLKDWIDESGLYPITCISGLSSAEKKFLLEKEVVLVKELSQNLHWLAKAGVSEPRFSRIRQEIQELIQESAPNQL